MIRHLTRAALVPVVLVVLSLAAVRAAAGPVLLARVSDLRATGASSSGEYNLSNGSDDFAPFTDGLLSDDGLPARSSAQQHSAPQIDPTGALAGAAADGSARAAVVTDIVDAFSAAETDFDLVFRVEGKASTFTFDGTLAASGDASAGVLLHPKDDPDAPPVFSVDVADETKAVRQSTVLEPGTYGLSVWAFARGTPAESLATYSVAVTLKDGEPGVVPMPLPAAVTAGTVGLGFVALLFRRRVVVRG
jgi:hypothetical protein